MLHLQDMEPQPGDQTLILEPKFKRDDLDATVLLLCAGRGTAIRTASWWPATRCAPCLTAASDAATPWMCLSHV